MSKKNYSKTKPNSRVSEGSNYNNKLMLLPLIIIITFIPLIVRYKSYETGLVDFTWFFKSDIQADFFLYYKSLTFILVSFTMFFILIWQYVSRRFSLVSNKSIHIFKNGDKTKFTKAFIPLITYACLALLSTIFSQYASFGFKGIFEQFESIFVLLGYCLVVYYAFLFVNTKEDIDLLLKWLLVGVIILTILGITQASGNDFFSSTLGRKLIVPSKYWEYINELKYTMEANRVYLTLYNPNYVGLYTALIVPILLVLLIFTKNRKPLIMYSIGIIGLLLCMIASSSRNGFVALCVSFIFILILFRKILLKNWKVAISGIGLLLIGFILFNAITGNAFINRLKAMITDIHSPEYTLSYIKTNDDNVEISYNSNVIYIQEELIDDTYISYNAVDEDNKPVPINLDNSTNIYTITDPRFASLTIHPVKFENFIGFTVTIDGTNWTFTNHTGNNSYYYYNSFERFEKIVPAESAIFTNYESMGSGRGYIWSRTIPLLKDNILLGSGADTFSLVYPQNDYIGRFHNGYISSITTKPHNMYLQIAVQTGVISLIAFLSFYGIYFISCMKLYIHNKFDSYMSQVGAAIFVGTIGYMISGIFNDSTITVSPVFWALMGIGLAVNYQLKEPNYSK